MGSGALGEVSLRRRAVEPASSASAPRAADVALLLCVDVEAVAFRPRLPSR